MPTSSVTQKTRTAYLDLLRVVGALMVVMIHTTAYLLNTTPVGSPVFVLSAVLDALSQAAVPLFVMVSGSLLLDEGRPVTIRRAARHYAAPLLGLYAFWSVVFALVNKVLQPLLLEHAAFSAAMLRAFGKACVEGMYHMWYLPMAAVLYLLTPLLRQFVRQDALPLVRWYLLLSGVFQFVLPLPLLLPGAEQSAFAALYTDMHAAPLLGYPAYYVLGWYLSHSRPARRWPLYAAGLAGLAGMVAGTLLVSARLGEGYTGLLEPLLLPCGLYSAAVFAFFAWELPGLRGGRVLTALSGCTFGVYILHAELLQLFRQAWPYTAHPVGYIAAVFGGVTLLSLIATLVLRHIPGLRRTVRG